MKQFEELRTYCNENHLPYTEQTAGWFSRFYEMLIETNKVMNLTAVTEPSEVERKHFIDSLAAAPFIQTLCRNSSEGTGSVIDIGTGAGFPGIPLSFVLPEARFVLADSLQKRIGFLQDVIRELKIPHAEALQGRAEDLGRGPHRELHDCCVSRAVADASVLLEYCLPLIKTGGCVILYKSGNFREELNKASYAMTVLGGELEGVHEFQLGHSSIKRSLIMIRKVRNTPEKYPRRAGKPAKSPLSR